MCCNGKLTISASFADNTSFRGLVYRLMGSEVATRRELEALTAELHLEIASLMISQEGLMLHDLPSASRETCNESRQCLQIRGSRLAFLVANYDLEYIVFLVCRRGRDRGGGLVHTAAAGRRRLPARRVTVPQLRAQLPQGRGCTDSGVVVGVDGVRHHCSARSHRTDRGRGGLCAVRELVFVGLLVERETVLFYFYMHQQFLIPF